MLLVRIIILHFIVFFTVYSFKTLSVNMVRMAIIVVINIFLPTLQILTCLSDREYVSCFQNLSNIMSLDLINPCCNELLYQAILFGYIQDIISAYLQDMLEICVTKKPPVLTPKELCFLRIIPLTWVVGTGTACACDCHYTSVWHLHAHRGPGNHQ